MHMSYFILFLPFLFISGINSQNCVKSGSKGHVKYDCDGKGFPKMEDIPKDVTELYVRKNSLHNIPFLDFSNFTKLQKIYLSINMLNQIPAIQSPSLISLFLDLNKIDSAGVPGDFHCPNLQILQLSGNDISSVAQKDFQNLTKSSLIVLQMSETSLKIVDKDTFIGFTKLKKLEMKNNPKLESCKDLFEMFSDLPSLESLDVSGSFVGSDCDFSTISKPLSKLQHLFLSGLKLNKLSNSFGSLFPDLTTLDVSSSSISSIDPTAFNPMTSLNRLVLSKNLISDLDGATFSKNKNLKELYLDQNQLTKLSLPLFQPLQISLEILWLNDNKLSDFTSLYVKDKDFKRTFAGLISLNIIDVGGNPLNCSCDLQGGWFVKWIQGNIVFVKSKANVLCSDGQPIVNVKCAEPTTTTATTPITTTETTITSTTIISTTQSSTETSTQTSTVSTTTVPSTTSTINPTTTSTTPTVIPPTTESPPQSSTNLIVLVVCSILILIVFISGIIFFICKKRSSSSPRTSGLLNTDYANEESRCTDCLPMVEFGRLVFTRMNPLRSSSSEDRDHLLNNPTDEPFVVNSEASNHSLNVVSQVFLLFVREDQTWSDSFHSQLHDEIVNGTEIKVVNEINQQNLELLKNESSPTIVVLSHSSIQHAAGSGCLENLINMINSNSSPTIVLTRNSVASIKQFLVKKYPTITLNCNEMCIECDREQDNKHIINQVLTLLNLNVV